MWGFLEVEDLGRTVVSKAKISFGRMDVFGE